MKTFAIALVLSGMVLLRASAQVTVEVSMDQDEFLPGEAVPLAVKVTTLSGQQLHLGADPGWLTFSVESVDGMNVIKKSEVTVPSQLDLVSSQLGIMHVDVEPDFDISRIGRYKVTAYLHIKDWSVTVN